MSTVTHVICITIELTMSASCFHGFVERLVDIPPAVEDITVAEDLIENVSNLLEPVNTNNINKLNVCFDMPIQIISTWFKKHRGIRK